MERDVQTGQVRAVLWKHLASLEAIEDPSGSDPSAFLPADGLASALHRLDPARQAEAAGDYVDLWAHTFPTLTRQLRGRPDQALRLFVNEVYPFLRGERRAARVESMGNGKAEVLLASDLPPAYLGGLLESFVALSGAQATTRPLGGERFEVAYKVGPTDRVAWLIQNLALLRVPMLVTAALAAALGIALAPSPAILDAIVALVAAVAAQAAANAVHDLRSPRLRGPLDTSELPRWWRLGLAASAYVAAGAGTVWFIVQGRPGVLAFAAGGLLLSLAYSGLRDQGLGPLLAGLTHGPVVVAGALYAVGGDVTDAAWVLPAVVFGLFTAAIQALDDMADRPLDEAAGKRTLAVRLPAARHLIAFGALLALAAVGLGIVTAPAPWLIAATAIAVLPWTARILLAVRAHLDDPRSLAGSRAGLVGLHILAAALLILRTEVP